MDSLDSIPSGGGRVGVDSGRGLGGRVGAFGGLLWCGKNHNILCQTSFPTKRDGER